MSPAELLRFPVPPRAGARAAPGDVAARFRRLAAEAAGWPLPGSGRTRARFDALARVAAEDLSVGRLVEAHADAVAICAEAERPELARGALAVWASDGAAGRLEAAPVPGGWRLAGVKQFCSGSAIADRALVTAHAPDGLRLFAVSLPDDGIAVDTGDWAAPAFAGTATGTVRFAVRVGYAAAVGEPGFYLRRPGFWHGAIGVAACWAGGARGLVDRHVERHRRDDPHALAHLGALLAEGWGMSAALGRAADEVDADPLDRETQAMRRALAVRHIVDRGCREVLTRLGRAGGARPAAFDAWVIQQSADLALYIQQCHGERDLEALGRASLASRRD